MKGALGQFIDHDLTFDPASSLQKVNDPDALVDFRTPRFDLDNLYGRGPDDQPYMYQGDGVRFVLGRALTGNSDDASSRDLQRTAGGRAIIGDPRNDENVIISQLQAAFLRFHNRVADVLKASGPRDFAKVQEVVRWHYQWVVLHDFLPTIIGKDMLFSILPHLGSGKSILHDRPILRFYQPQKEPYMPVEFSVAAYRFGHSMVRPQYRLNEVTPPVEGNPDPSGKNDPRLPIFSSTALSLVGFNEFPSTWAVDWRLFFKLGIAPPSGKNRIQPAYKIDTSLVNPLGKLPEVVTGPTPVPSLALRNLLRSLRMGLPSGQAVARAMGEPIIPDEELRVGKANEDDFKNNPTLASISSEFSRNAPLWYYVLADSQNAFKDNNTPIRLGRIGGRIVGEVFAGILLGDHHSFLNHCPNWKPHAELAASDGTFGIADLIKQAMQA
ncbi:Animal haem peroxidase [Planctomicrobium piriforme]|uniref:Animal haem peroxidase n=2 Tax=Planctomicrobium piriforme TaxID=1576369 RepID=A0A1I3GID7_9PLAN|nr:Animal haem peroxidase [Planctomicrobium piriforme]